MWQFDLPCVYCVYNLRPPRIELGSFAVLLCWGGRVFGGGDFSEHKLPLCEIYTPSVTKGGPRETEKRRPRATRPERHGPSAREGNRADESSEEAPTSPPPSLSVRASAVETKRKTETKTGTPADESPCVEGKVLILIKHRKPNTRRRRRRLSPARSCRWGWSSSSPGRPCARRGP